jgi:hypothetical protein
LIKWLVVVGFLLISCILTRLIPFSFFFRNVNTMMHELGHAAAALLTSGEVHRIVLNADHSGVTFASVTSGWSAVLVGLAGYIPASLFAVLMFYLHYRRQEKRGLMAISLIAVLMLLLFVHEGFGVGWLMGFVLLNLVMWLIGGTVCRLYFLLLAFLTLEESVLGAVNLLLIAIVDPPAAGDAANLAAATGIPAPAWSALFVIVAFLCAREAIRLLFRGMRERLQRYERRHEPFY